MTVETELQQISVNNDGILKPENVVEYAKNPETSLHSKFTWDDTKAAYEYRLEEARRVIRVHFVDYEEVDEPVRMFVSLMPDRSEPGGGYRKIEDVMGDEDMRKQLLRQSMEDMKRWRAKYRTLVELKKVFEAMDQVAKEIGD